MNIQIILCHPHQESFNHAIAKQVETSLISNNHSVNFHDLYVEGFDPIIPYCEIVGECTDPLVNRHIAELKACHGVVIIHPNWWGKPPALMAGWIDRVMRMNMAYTFEKGKEGAAPIGLLSIDQVLVLNTSNTTTEREHTVFGDPLERIWRDCIFDFCGVTQFTRRTFSVVTDSDPAQRSSWLLETEQLVSSTFPR